jgi:hypothetical protein
LDRCMQIVADDERVRMHALHGGCGAGGRRKFARWSTVATRTPNRTRRRVTLPAGRGRAV